MEKASSTRMIFVAILSLFLYGSNLSLLGTLLPDLLKRFNLGLSQAGTIAAIQAVGLMLASLAVGPLIDNKGKKTALLIGMALMACALFALPHSAGWQSIAALMFILGVGMAIILVAGNSLAADVSDEKRGSLLSLTNVFYGVGGLFTPFVAGHFFRGHDANLTYLVGSMAILIFIVTSAIPMPLPSHERHFNISAAMQMPGKPLLALLSLFALLYVSCEVAIWDFLPKFLVSQGITEGRALTILAFGFGLGMVIGRIAGTAIFAKFSSYSISVAGALFLIAFSFWTLNTSDQNIAWTAVFCLGLIMGPIMPAALAMTGDAFSRLIGTSIGILVTAGFIGATMSTRLIGAVAETSGLKTALLLIPAFAAAMVVVAIVLHPMLVRARTQEVPAGPQISRSGAV